MLLGQVLVLRARAATGRDIRALLDLTPKTAWRIASAGITLTGGDIAAIVRARRLSTATLRNIRQNLFFSFVFNGIGVPVAAGVIYPVFGILLSPMFAGGAMALSSLSVGVNALRLGTVKL